MPLQGGLFRLDLPPAVALAEVRVHSKRFNFLARRWGSGPYRNPDKSVLKCKCILLQGRLGLLEG